VDLEDTLRAQTDPATLERAADRGEKATYVEADLDLGWERSYTDASTGEEYTRGRIFLDTNPEGLKPNALKIAQIIGAQEVAKGLREDGYDARAVSIHHPEYYSVSGHITPASDTTRGVTVPARDEYGVVVQWAQLPPQGSAEAADLPRQYYAESIDEQNPATVAQRAVSGS
jgi:hypothetical protein